MSTVSRAARPKHVNLNESGDYPIILGDSLKDSPASSASLTQVMYNWEPKNGFRGQKGLLKQVKDSIHLSYQDAESSASAYTYDGRATTTQSNQNGQTSSRLILVFDEAKSVFVLEKIAASFELNIKSAPNQTEEDLKRHRQIPESHRRESDSDESSKHADTADDQVADPANPYDFRHFLTEAKGNAEKTAHAGSRTPVPGNGTPISRVASPSLGAGRFANTSSFRPAAVPVSTSTSIPATQKRKPAENGFKSSSATTNKKLLPVKRKDPAVSKSSSQPLSKERVSSSDEEVSDTITVNAERSKTHHRNNLSTSSYGRSPHIIVNNGDLVVDMGSPPRPPRRKMQLDPEIFGSRPHTPRPGNNSTNTPASPLPPPTPTSSSRRPTRNSDLDIEMEDPPSSPDENSDVDDLILEDHTAAHTRKSSSSHPKSASGTKQDSDSHHHRHHHLDSAPTPPIAQDDDDDDNDDALAKEFEAALEEEGDEDEEHGGRGLANEYGHVHEDDESEVSEEE